MKTSLSRGLAAIAAGALGLALGAAAQADQGNAVIEAKSDGAVVLHGTQYRVNDATVLESKDGNRLRLADLPSVEQGASNDAAAVWYEADDASPPTAQLIRLTGGMPN